MELRRLHSTVHTSNTNVFAHSAVHRSTEGIFFYFSSFLGSDGWVSADAINALLISVQPVLVPQHSRDARHRYDQCTVRNERTCITLLLAMCQRVSMSWYKYTLCPYPCLCLHTSVLRVCMGASPMLSNMSTETVRELNNIHLAVDSRAERMRETKRSRL